MAWRFVKQPDGKLARWSDVPTDQTKPALPTLAEIEAMEALLGRATPGPWICETHAARRRILAPEEATATIAPHGWAHQALFGDVRIRSNVEGRARHSPEGETARDAARQTPVATICYRRCQRAVLRCEHDAQPP